MGDFVDSMRAESQQDPSERLLSSDVYDGLAFIPSLLAPEKAIGGLKRSGSGNSFGSGNSLSEPFMADDQLAAMGIDVKEMDSFRKAYAAFRLGEARGASGDIAPGVRAG